MIERASDEVARSLRAAAICEFIMALLVFANIILLSVRIARFIHLERLPSREDIRRAGMVDWKG
jgi:hypothetical protein